MKKFFLANFNSLVLNFLMLLILLIGIQNNHDKKSIDFLIFKTIELPIGFIVGSGLMAGTLCGNFISSIANFENQ